MTVSEPETSNTARSLSRVEQARLIPRIITASAISNVFGIYTVFGPMTALLFNALGLSKGQIGAVLAILPFSSIVALGIGPLLAKAGPKRLCVSAYLIRKLALLPILVTPLLTGTFGSDIVFPWVAGIMLVFGLARTFAETGYYPWSLELIDNTTRGKLVAFDTTVATLIAILASYSGSLLVGAVPGLTGYLLLFAIGIIFGLLYVAIFSTFPGGLPQPKTERPDHGYFSDLAAPLRDGNFMRYLTATALVNISIGYASFLPLYLVEWLGLQSSHVFMYDICQRIGILLCTFFWGWNADRFGSRPVMTLGLLLHGCGIFLFACLLPQARWIVLALYGMAFTLAGIWMAYPIATNRYLFARAVPPEKRNPYMRVFYAVAGCSAALAPLSAGWVLDSIGGWGTRIGFLWINAFTILVLAGGIMMLVAAAIFSRLAADTDKGSGDFFSIFTRGSFFLALESSLRFHYALDEDDRITTTTRMGIARSAMNQEEMLEALSDLSFNVRYEAIISLTRMPPTQRVLQALIGIIQRQEPELSIIAAWALGRIGDTRALPALRKAMSSEYALLRARIVRTLGVFKDAESLEAIAQGFATEQQDTLRVAYAGALGALRDARHLSGIMELLRRIKDQSLRHELLLALARILGGEMHFVRLWRKSRNNFQAAAADALLQQAKRFPMLARDDAGFATQAAKTAELWAREDTAAATAGVIQCFEIIQRMQIPDPIRLVLKTSCKILAEDKTRLEIILLGLHATDIAFAEARKTGRFPLISRG